MLLRYAGGFNLDCCSRFSSSLSFESRSPVVFLSASHLRRSMICSSSFLYFCPQSSWGSVATGLGSTGAGGVVLEGVTGAAGAWSAMMSSGCGLGEVGDQLAGGRRHRVRLWLPWSTRSADQHRWSSRGKQLFDLCVVLAQEVELLFLDVCEPVSIDVLEHHLLRELQVVGGLGRVVLLAVDDRFEIASDEILFGVRQRFDRVEVGEVEGTTAFSRSDHAGLDVFLDRLEPP